MKTYVATVCLTKSYTDKMCNQVLLQKEYMDDKWRNMRLTARGQKRFEKEAEAAIIEYSKLRKAAIDEYNNLVKSGEIIPPHETKLEALLSVARGHPDNEGTQAARRLLKKRYGIISW